MKRAIMAVLLSAVMLASGCGDASILPTEPSTAVTAVTTTAVPTTTATTVPTEPPKPVNLLEDEAVTAQIEAIAAPYHPVGLQVAVVKDGEVAGVYASGWATVDTDPMTVDHKIRIASVSKVITGMAAMLAIEDGALDLDADLATYWDTTVRNPSYPDVPITMRHLLTHTSSITPLYGWDYSSRYDDVRARFAYHYDATKPGEMYSWMYNNYGLHIAGMTVELATGRHLDDLLHERVFAPLSIDAAFHAGDLEATDLLVTRYNENGYVVHTVEDQLAVHADEAVGGNGTHFSGGLTISAGDLAKLAALLANDGAYQGQQLLDPSSVALMETCMDGTWGNEISQAIPLCYREGICGRESLYYHSGKAHGVHSMFSYDPVEKDGVIMISVGADTVHYDYDFTGLAYELSEHLYGIL